MPGARAQSKPEKPVAVIGAEALYEKDYMPQVQSQLFKICKQEYELRRKTIEDAINKSLLRQEVGKKGMTEEELLRQEADSKVAEPTEAEVEQHFVAQMFCNAGLINVSKDQVREQLRQAGLEQARAEYFQGLRERAG